MSSGNYGVNASLQSGIYGAEVTCYIIGVIAVALRLTARKIGKQSLWWDDWLIIAALLLNSAYFASAIVAIDYGMGRHFITISNKELFNKEILVVNALYAAALSVTRFSVIAFYWRIFNVSKAVRIFLSVLSLATLGWCLSVVFISTFECTPVKRIWDPNVSGTCVDVYAFFLAVIVVNFIIDVVLLVVPIPHIIRLKQTLQYRLAVCCTFLLGGFICIISIIRLTIIVKEDFQSPDFSWNDAIFFMWCGIETGISILAACLPSYKPLLVAMSARSRGSFKQRSDVEATTLANSSNSLPKSQSSTKSSASDGNNKPVQTYVNEVDTSAEKQTNRGAMEAHTQ